METTEEENIHNTVNKALTDFSEKLKEEYRLHGFKTKEFFEVIDKIMGSFNHSPQENCSSLKEKSEDVSKVSEDTHVQKNKGCGDICANCGHPKKEHLTYHTKRNKDGSIEVVQAPLKTTKCNHREMGEYGYVDCDCKKFKPKKYVHPLDENVRLCREAIEDNNKGCGKVTEINSNGREHKCGEDGWLHPKCQERKINDEEHGEIGNN